MDKASVFAASLFAAALHTQGPGGEHIDILDACAAPGGKTLVLATMLSRKGMNYSILANELSSDRRRRLSGVLDLYLAPKERERVTVSGFDAAKAGARKSEHGRFDAILLDAPCSSERHVLSDEQALLQWTPNRVKNLAIRQWSLLSSCLLMAKQGALIAYVTCALTSYENDKVVLRALKKFGAAVCLFDPREAVKALINYGVAETALPAFEKTGNGIAISPDIADGAGPIYISLIRKL
jgi:16S rRNA (cytosine1407-C5)-methyltransferase